MADWRDCIQAQTRDLHIGGRITFGSGSYKELTGAEIAALTISEGADGMLAPGSVLSAECALELVNDEGQWLPGGSCLGSRELIGATVTLELGVDSQTQTLWRDLGCFQVESAAVCEAEALIKLHCADSISAELSAVFNDTAAYPATLQQVWNALIAQTRYVFTGNIPNGGAIVDSAPEWNGATLREVMGRIAEAAGCFVQIDRTGSLTLKRVWDTSVSAYAIGADAYMRLERGLLSYGPLDALKLLPVGGEAEQRIYYSDAEQSALYVWEIENNPLFADGAAHLDALAQGALGCVSGFAVRQMDFSWRGDPELCIGDRFTLTDTFGSAYTGVLSRQTIRFGPGFSADCSCAVTAETDSGLRRAVTPEGGLNASRLVGAVDGNLLSVGSVTTNKLSAGSVTAEKLASGAVDTQLLTAVNAVIDCLEAGSGTFTELDAAYAKMQVLIAGSAEFGKETVRHLIADLLDVEDVIGTGNVTLKNVTVERAQIMEATLSDLVIRGDDGHYYQITVDAETGVACEDVTDYLEDEYGTEILPGTIVETEDGARRKVIETDLSVADLSVTGKLEAINMLADTISAKTVDTDVLISRKEFTDALYTSQIFGGKSLQTIAGEAEGLQSIVTQDAEGSHFRKSGSTNEVLIDDESVNIVQNGRKFSRFAAEFAQHGNYQIRAAADGGLVFKPVREGGV